MTHETASGGKLIPRMRARLRVMRYSPRTEERYVDWVVRYVRFHELRHPKELGARDVEELLTFLAAEQHVAASTQNQALAALLYLYKEVLRQPIAYVDDIVRAKRPTRVPVVLTRDEVRRVLVVMAGTPQMVAQLLYGSGLRLMEACTLRLKDVDLERRQLAIDARGGGGHVELPSAYGRKSPTASREYVDVDSGERRRHQVHETVVLRVVKEAARVAGLRIHGHLMAENCRTAVTDVYGKAGRVWLATLTLRAATRLQVDLLPEVIDALNVRIRQMDQNVARLARHHAVAPQLQTVPGIGVFGAMLFLA